MLPLSKYCPATVVNSLEPWVTKARVVKDVEGDTRLQYGTAGQSERLYNSLPVFLYRKGIGKDHALK